ncbi:F-box protein At5g49610-like [Quercus lobata]|nr:F-box protein At5g49610-like [Quercus lobata]
MVLRKTKKKEESPTLPKDMIFEILSRITSGDIGRCRLVSKDWNLITYDSSFIQAHSERTKTIDGFFIGSLEWGKPVNKFVSINEPDPKSKLSLDFIPGPVSIIAATKQGLLLCVDNYSCRNHKYYVCKPSTKQWKKIPNPRTRYHTVRCAMVVLKSNPLHYKIIRFSTHSLRTIMTYKSMTYSFLFCEIFDSKAWAWKKLKDVVMLPKDEWLGFHDPVVSVSGSLYWLTNNNMVFVFHVDSNKCTTFDLPFPLCKKKYFDPMKLVEYQGRVGMLCKKGCDIQVWMMENHEVWSKKQTVSIEPAKLSASCYPVAFQSSDIMLMGDDTNMIHYDFRSGNSKMSNVWIRTRPMGIFPFHSDFELVDLKRIGVIRKNM